MNTHTYISQGRDRLIHKWFTHHPPPKKRNKGQESVIQASILSYLTLKKIFHFKVNTTGIYKKETGAYIPSPSAGCPDIICIREGHFIGIEVKSPTGRQSDAQKQFQENIENAGGKYYLVRSLEEVIAIIE